MTDWSALQSAIAGEVLLAGSPGYEAARKPAIARFHDICPQAVVRCRTPGDVAETIAFARRAGLRTAARSGGHCFAGRSSTDGIVVDVSPMRLLSVSDGVATVGAGARLGDLYDALEQHGLTIPAGCGPAVGIAGLTLGGGLGILGRKHGLTSDSLLAAQVVLADGRVVDCDEDRDGELFWALRGAGGGGLGIVTSLTFRTLRAPRATGFHLVWPHTAAAALIGAWQGWAPGAPDELAASLLVTATGDVDQPPVVNLFGAMVGGEGETDKLLDELVARAGAEPSSADRRELAFRETKRYLAGLGDDEPSERAHLFSRSEYFRRLLPAEAIAALLDHFGSGRARGEARELDFTPWGGAYNRVPAGATAFAHRGERFLLKHAVVVEPGADAEAATRWLERSWTTVRPYGSGGVYPNFPDPALEHSARAYYGDNLDRLTRVKRSYDPDDFFRFPQSLPVG
jgi:FAD/FMN-containing dehydrogenase